MNLKSNLIKLSKMLLQLKSVMAGDVELIYEGELAVGIEVYTLENEEYVAAPDGEYKLENAILVIVEGKVSEIRSTEPEPEPIAEEPIVEPTVEELSEEPTVEEVVEVVEEIKEDARIAELEAVIAEKDAHIAELEAKIVELGEALSKKDEALKMSADIPAKEKVKRLPKVENGLKFNVLNK